MSFVGAHSQMNTTLFQNRPVETQNRKKIAFGTPSLPDLLTRKHWFTSSVRNFCRWVADVHPRETTLSGEERGETSAVHRLHLSLRMSIRNFLPWLYSTSSNQVIFAKKIDCQSAQMLFTFFICSSELWLCKEIPGLFPPRLLCW